MSQNKRKQHSTQFKAKVALEAIKGEKTIAHIAHPYSLHSTTINNWKRHLLAGASELFEPGRQSSATEPEATAQINELHRQTGELKSIAGSTALDVQAVNVVEAGDKVATAAFASVRCANVVGWIVSQKKNVSV